MLLAVIVLLALMMIAMSVALPKIAKEIQRDREVETMQRGKQYIRAIKMYYKKNGAYPPNMDALVKPTGMATSAFCARSTLTPPPARTSGSPSILARTRHPPPWDSLASPWPAPRLQGSAREPEAAYPAHKASAVALGSAPVARADQVSAGPA